MQNKVVVHFSNGSLVKGITSDFFPNKPSFHVEVSETGKTREVHISELKGIFFVKSYEGNSAERHRRNMDRQGLGRKIQVDFRDGETLIGYTSGYSPARTGFFVFPADPEGNNEKVFVLTAATENVTFI